MLSFSDSLGGECLENFEFIYIPSVEQEVTGSFQFSSKMLTMLTERTDLETIEAELVILRENGELLQKVSITYYVTVPVEQKTEDGSNEDTEVQVELQDEEDEDEATV